jgi:hypothetical protein
MIFDSLVDLHFYRKSAYRVMRWNACVFDWEQSEAVLILLESFDMCDALRRACVLDWG